MLYIVNGAHFITHNALWCEINNAYLRNGYFNALRFVSCVVKIMNRDVLAMFNFNNYSIMVFTEYMNSLPDVKEETIKKLVEVTSTSRSTVMRWIKGEIIPPPVKRRLIAQELNKSEKELFPNVYAQP